MKRLRIYTDTSVLGGGFDYLFADASRGVIEKAVHGEIMLLLSEHVFDELKRAPGQVRSLVERMPHDSYERTQITSDARKLHEIYMNDSVVPRKAAADALHVACATVARANAIVSWNYKHIVHKRRRERFNELNRHLGYEPLRICTP